MNTQSMLMGNGILDEAFMKNREKMKWTELRFIDVYLEKIREGKETMFGGEAGTGAWWF